MNGKDYMRKVCPTTSMGKDPNREDVADAFDDGYANGYNDAISKACKWLKENADHYVGHYINDDDTYLDDSFIMDFKKSMEE